MKRQLFQLLFLSFFICLTPIYISSQTSIVSYEQGLENCRKEMEYAKNNPDKIILHDPVECIIGSQIPEFYCKTLDGKLIQPDYFKGKITVINFWYTACVPCIEEIGGLNAIVDQYGKDKINYLGICLDDDADLKTFIQKYPWQFDQVSNGKVLIFDYFKFKGWGFPTTFILDRNAKIIAAFSGGKSDERAIEEIKQEISPVLDKLLH
jgi:peroxiredoxin